MKKIKIIILTVIILLFLTGFVSNALTSSNNTQQKILNNGKNKVYDLLIIAPKVFSKEIIPLVNHKNKFGVKTIVVDVEEVYQQMFWHGRDDAEKIKYFIKDAIGNWGIKYVLLVGGLKGQSPTQQWWIPVRYSYLDRNYEEYTEHKFISDLYFADIYDSDGNFSSWDDNNNGVYGEWPENQSAVDKPDLYPDVYVGRLPCRNSLQVRVAVKKIISYETGNFSDSWFKNMVVVAGDTYPDKTDYYDGEVYTQMGLDMMPGFKPVKLWASNGSLKNWMDVAKAINRGCGFIWFSGHGNPTSWATHPPNSSAWINGLKLWNIPFLVNGKKLPVCIVGSGCFNSMFNVSLFNSYWVFGLPVTHCWSEALTLKPYGGCIAVIGSTAFSYESPDINTGNGGIEWLDMHFFDQYGQHNVSVLGEIWGKTVTCFLQNFSINWSDNSSNGDALIAKNTEMWLLMGDPSLRIGGYY